MCACSAQGREGGSHRHGNADKYKYASKRHSLLALRFSSSGRASKRTRGGGSQQAPGVPVCISRPSCSAPSFNLRGVWLMPLQLPKGFTAPARVGWELGDGEGAGSPPTETPFIPPCNLEKAKCNHAAYFSAQKAGGKAVPKPRLCLSPGRIPAASQGCLCVCKESVEELTGPRRLEDPDTKGVNSQR